MPHPSSPPPPHIAGPAPAEDHLGLVARAVPAAILAGAGLIGLALLGVRRLVAAAPPPAATPEAVDPFGPAGVALLAGTLLGCALAAGLTWRLLAPVGSYYRRGGLAMVAAFATLVAALPTMPLYQALGAAGLWGFAVLALVPAALLGRAALRRRAA